MKELDLKTLYGEGRKTNRVLLYSNNKDTLDNLLARKGLTLDSLVCNAEKNLGKSIENVIQYILPLGGNDIVLAFLPKDSNYGYVYNISNPYLSEAGYVDDTIVALTSTWNLPN